AKAHKLIGRVRKAVRKNPNASAELRTAVGIGRKLNKTDVTGIMTTLAAIATHAPELRECLVPERAIAHAASLATQLEDSKKAQKGAVRARASTTEERTDAHLRIERAVDAIHIVGSFAFLDEPSILSRFDRLASDTGPTDEDLEGEDQDADDDELDDDGADPTP